MAYDFSTLNDKDFELLTRDILTVKLNIDFQSFKSGKDKGIDLRYASNNSENEIIVQVKHFLVSGLTNLKSVLKKQEVAKVKALNPLRYIFVTSIPLSAKNKEDIKVIFNPYIKSTADILGKNDLNNFLRNNPQIVENHFKLWLSGTTVLKRILNNGIKGRSLFFDKKIKDRVRIFVPSKTHKEAVEILNSTNFILITGDPGTGKTTLADMLTYQLLAEDFELVYVREIREAEDMDLPGKKQVFYFDDFLGSSTLDLKSSRNADSAMVDFTNRIISDKKKRLILTCRTTLLNKAKIESEKIENSKIEISNYEVKVDNYREIEKAKILYNHIYFSNLSDELKMVFFQDKFYWRVIKHRNYNPRVIQFFTDIDFLQPEISYSKEVIDFLDNPSKIWEKSFLKQISHEARLFLSTLYALGGKYVIGENKIKEAFDARLDYEVSNNNYSKPTGIFNKVVRELLGGFITRIHKTEKNYTAVEYQFLNPSIEDFLYFYFSSNLEEYLVILRSAKYIGQFKERISTKTETASKRIFLGERDHYNMLMTIFFDRLPSLIGAGTSKEIETLNVLIRLFNWQDIKEKAIDILDNLKITHLSWDDRDNLIEILDYIASNNKIAEFNFSIKEVLHALSSNMSYHFQIQAFSSLISKHSIYNQILSEAKNLDLEYYNKIQNSIDQSWSNSLDYFMGQIANLNTITEKNKLISIIEERKNQAREINKFINFAPSPVIDGYIFNYEEQINKNLIFSSEKETQIKNLGEEQDILDEKLQINQLFNSEDLEDLDLLPF